MTKTQRSVTRRAAQSGLGYTVLCGIINHGAWAAAQGYPTRSVTLVVPYSAGGGIDVVTRMLAQRLEQRLGQAFVVNNRVGAGGMIASAYVAKSASDGYTLLTASDAQLAIQVSLRKHLDYDPTKDFAPIAIVGTTPFALLVNPALPVTSVTDLIKLAKSNPGGLTFASSGVGSVPHLVMVQFMMMSGSKMRHIPYRGTSEALNDVVAGRVNVIFSGLTGISNLVAAGKLRAVGVSSRTRVSILPSVPTIAESGVPGFQTVSFVMMVAPAATPQDIVTELNNNINAVIAQPDIRQRYEAIGYLAEPSPAPGELKKFIKVEIAQWAEVIARAGLTHSQE